MTKNHIKLVLKIILISGALILVFSKIDRTELAQNLKQVAPWSFIAGFIFLLLAQITSAFRTKYYYHNNGLDFNSRFAIGTYFVGMLYNNILPGGIGGDGYKIYLMKKLANFSKATSFRTLISDRASGLYIMLTIAFFLLPFSGINIPYLIPTSLILLAINTIGYFISIKILLKEQPRTALGAIPYSLIVQGLNAIICLVLIVGLGLDINNIPAITTYVILFFVANIASIFPISIGGIGIRELVFVYGASWIGLDAEMGVAFSLLFFVITLGISLIGLLYTHKLVSLYGGNHGSTRDT